MSKKIEGHINALESVLNDFRSAINEKGETTQTVQVIINVTLDHLDGWYEMRRMFS